MINEIIQTKFYETNSGKQPYKLWLDKLDKTIQVIITARITKLRRGNFGKFKPIRNGVYELIIDHGAGYRIYYGKLTDILVLILLCGDKSTQNRDIEKALQYWQEYKENK